MTITNTDRVVVATGNAATTVWPYAFNIPDAASANVEVTETATGAVTVIGSGDYTITGLGDGSGTVTYPKSGTPLASTHTITIYRDVPATQTTTVINQTKYDASVVMAVWDRIVMMVQDLKETIGRQLTFPIGDSSSAELPNATNRASRTLGFDANGDIAMLTSLGAVAVSAFMETVLDDTTPAEARATLEVTDVEHSWIFVENTYDFSVDGALVSVESADFEDGYEYMFHLEGVLGASAFTSVALELYGVTDAAYHPNTILVSSTNDNIADDCWGWVEIDAARSVSKLKHSTALTHEDANISSSADAALNIEGTSGDFTQQDVIWVFGTAQKIGKARWGMGTGNLNGGIIAMYRRSVA